MFDKMIKLMRTDYSYYLLKRYGTYCSDCPKNKCVLCVEEKKYLNEKIKERGNNEQEGQNRQN